MKTYGYHMTGIRKAAGESKGLEGYYSGEYLELFYDRQTGEVWTVYQYSIGQNSWTQYDDPDVIKVQNISSPVTMQQIADLIADCLHDLESQEAVS